MLGRLGILMLGWHYLFWLGIILIVIGATLQTGATSAVKAVKFSAKLVGTPAPEPRASSGYDQRCSGALRPARPTDPRIAGRGRASAARQVS